MNTYIKIIDQQGLVKAIPVAGDENLRLAPGDHIHIDPQTISSEGVIVSGDDLHISLTSGATITIDNFFSDKAINADQQAMKTAWIGDIPVSSLQDNSSLPDTEYAFDKNGNFVEQPLLSAANNQTQNIYPGLEYVQDSITSDQPIAPSQLKVIKLAVNTTTSDSELEDNDSIVTDLRYSRTGDTTSNYGPINSSNLSSSNVDLVPASQTETIQIKQTANDIISSTASQRLSNNGETIQTAFPATNSNTANTTATNGNTTNTTAANNAPVITVPSAQAGDEDNAIIISGTSISDADIANGELTTSLSVTNGSIALNSITGLSFSSGADGTASMTFTGTLTNVNNALNSLTYQGTSNFNGNDTLNISVDDQGNTGSGGALVDNDSSAITVNAVNDAPVLTIPGSQAVNEDTALVINGTAIADDAVASDLEVALSVSDGTITLASTTGLTFSAGGDGTASMTFTGTLANVNNAITSLTYQGTANFNGNDTLNISVDDQGNTGSGGALVDNDSIAITVNAVNDAPVLTVPGSQAVNEDTALVINGTAIADVDVSGSDLEVTLSVSDGTITLASTTGLTFSAGGDGTASMTFTGTLANINTAIASLTYQGTSNFNGADTLNISVDDQGNTGSGGALVDNDSIAITVNAVNDAPVLTIPGSQAVNEDTALVINGTAIADDAVASDLEVTLSVSDGTITLASTTGLTFSAGGDGTASMTFTGTLANINTAIASLTYQGTSNFNGNDTLNISVDDQGNTGSGGALVDNDSIAITVNAVNDAPVLTVPGSQAVNEDTALVINGTTIADVDVSGSDLEVTLSVSDGTITLASTTGLTFSAGGDGTASMTFTGTLANINTAIASLTYQGTANFNGNDTLNISVDDQGNTGSGGALVDNDNIAITINPINDAPNLDPLPNAVAIKDEFVLINHNILQAQDIDDTPDSLTYTITGTLNGMVAFIDDIATAITSFTQQDVDNNSVVFVHDGSATITADFDFSLADGGEDGVLPILGTMTYTVEDSIQGTNGADTLNGTSDTDWIDGLKGNDTLSGNDGDDLLWGGNGEDTLNGGAGDDYLSGDDKDDDLMGDGGDDVLLGGNGADTLSGGAGDDTLYGDDKSDDLMGDDGNDSLFGGGWADTLSGGAGNDLLDGGAKDDTLNGGSGDDTFLFNTDHNVGPDVDTISDFSATDDTLDISALLVGYSDGVSDINDFLVIDNTGSVSIDANGTVGASNFTQIADLTTAPPTGTSIQVIADTITTTVEVV